MCADACAAFGTTSGRGIGKVWHLDTSHCWLQGMSARRRVNLETTHGACNFADLMAKELPTLDVNKHVEGRSICYPEARADGAPRVAEGKVGVLAPTDGLVTDRPREATLVAQGCSLPIFRVGGAT